MNLTARAYAASSMKEILFEDAATKRMDLASWRPILEEARSGKVALFYNSHDPEHKNAATCTIST